MSSLKNNCFFSKTKNLLIYTKTTDLFFNIKFRKLTGLPAGVSLEQRRSVLFADPHPVVLVSDEVSRVVHRLVRHESLENDCFVTVTNEILFLCTLIFFEVPDLIK